ncbi:MAG: DUF3631 domain-containing protein [Terriglobia bacterium]
MTTDTAQDTILKRTTTLSDEQIRRIALATGGRKGNAEPKPAAPPASEETGDIPWGPYTLLEKKAVPDDPGAPDNPGPFQAVAMEMSNREVARLLVGAVVSPLAPAAPAKGSQPYQKRSAYSKRESAEPPPVAVPAPDTDVEIDSAAVLAEVERFIAKFVILPSSARLPVALWGIATHLADSFDAFAYLALSSPLPQCGKTRTLEVLELLVATPWRGTAPTEAALFRFIETKQPTLLLDEVEALSKRNASERDSAVLAILLAGYKKGQTVPRCVGANHELQHFHVYGPKAFACIGSLPAALQDRCIPIPMQRRGPGETVSRFRYEQAKREAGPVRAGLEKAVRVLGAEIKDAYSKLPELAFLRDRDEELFAPLFAICAILAPERIDNLKHSAQDLCNFKTNDAVDDSLPQRLLADIQKVWPEGTGAMLTESLLQMLRDLPESPWGGEAAMSPRSLARKLRAFEVRPRLVRLGEVRGRGYIREELDRAFRRYLSPTSPEVEFEPLNV